MVALQSNILIVGFILLVNSAQAQQTARDSVWTVEIAEIVVTATRTPRSLRNVPMPTSVITRSAALASGVTRVSDLLSAYPGLTVTRDQFGAGIQLQGMDPAHTLILLDGEPVTGRSGGTIDLDRIPSGLVERIEIVRGPSSSLYGSEALAGVVNIITRRPDEAFAGEVGYRRQTHGTSNLDASISRGFEDGAARLELYRYASDGYDLLPEEPGTTAPRFEDLTLSGRLDLEVSSRSTARMNARFARLSQVSTAGAVVAGNAGLFEQDAGRTDWSVSTAITTRLAGDLRLRTSAYGSRSSSFLELFDPAAPARPQHTNFATLYLKSESHLNWVVGPRQLVTAGVGMVRESVEASRIAGGRRETRAAFAFAQHEFFVSSRFQVTASARWDFHSEYQGRLSPKIALQAAPSDRIRFRASLGTGFKSPTFQQLFLDFTNPGAGYSVVGSQDLENAIASYQVAGQIAYLLADVETFGTLQPEHSVSLNVGGDVDLTDHLQLRLNLFGNEVHDLIETQPIAAKPNGQFLFSYLNLRRVYTRGLETEVVWQPRPSLSMTAGYQYLQTRDRDVLEQIKSGSLFKRVDGRDQRVQLSDYGGLFNRAPHTASISASHRLGRTTTNLRLAYRHRYGFGDRNGNLILDDDSEYAPGYLLIDLTATYRLSNRFRAQGGIVNLTGRVFPDLVPALAGRIIHLGLNLSINGLRTE